MTAGPATASQTVGPFFSIALSRPAWQNLASAGPEGERIDIEGRVLDGAGAPVPDAVLEIWQADARGRYAHPDDPRSADCDPGFIGFGRASTGADGSYAFATIRPGRCAGADGRLQAPHVALSVFARGLLRRLVTRIYFSDEAAANSDDAVLASIRDPAARSTLIASREDGPVPRFRFDVILQGAGETAFLDL